METGATEMAFSFSDLVRAMSQIPEAFHDLFERETFATVATIQPDGTPHLTKVWVDYDPEANRVLVNTERGRKKERNVQQNPKIGIMIPDPDNHWRWVSVGGEVEEVTTDGARDHIDVLAQRYLGVEDYPNPIQTERVIIKIIPEDVITFTPD